MSESPIERLNYFNGQRLEADDLRLEQEYHVRLQRWLSRSLFSAGVADGLDVLPVDGGKRVLITPGLALDELGRAIILVQAVELVPQARYLCVRYAERKNGDGARTDGCPGKRAGHAACPGQPERILSEPEFLWKRELPSNEKRELVIAVLQLSASCLVEKVEGGPRLTAVTRPLARVRALSFGGEKDIDEKNPKVLNFHVRNQRPSSVTLHFSARDFSTLHYSEMGEVTPEIQGGGAGGAFVTDPPDGVDPHSHADGTLTATTEVPAHSHVISSSVFDPALTLFGGKKGLFVAPTGDTIIGHGQLAIDIVTMLVTGTTAVPDLSAYVTGFAVSTGGHSHDVVGKTSATLGDEVKQHTHPVAVTVGPTGSAGTTAVRGGNQLTFFEDLQITVDGKPVKTQILDQLKQTNPSVWSLITSFDGSPGHPLVQGTGPIRLDLIDGLSFDPDEMRPHTIVFSVTGSGNGGCIQYNLYVE